MIKGYLRLPSNDYFTHNVRVTKKFRNGHIQLYDVKLKQDWSAYPHTVKIKHTILGVEPPLEIRKEIIFLLKSFNFKMKEPEEMTDEEYDYIFQLR